jgi:hypothetical protein
MISFSIRANLFLGVCPYHFYDIYIGHKLTSSWPSGKSTCYNANYLISNISRKREFDEKIQG